MDKDNKIIFAGKMEDEDLAILLNGASAFVSASLFETWCEGAQKAVSCGIPVIAFNNSSFSELLLTTGILIKENDHNSFIRAMRAVKINENLRIRARALGIQQSNRFTIDKALSALDGIMIEISKEKYIPDEK